MNIFSLNPDTPLELILATVIFTVDLIIRIALIFYIPRNRKPTAAMAWLLTIFILPIIGTILFFVIGNTKLSKNRRAHQVRMSKRLKQFAQNLREEKVTAHVRSAFHTSAVLAEAFGDLPPTKGNKVDIISGYEEIIASMIAAIDTAKEYVYVEFFAMALDDTTEPFFACLERAIARGVKVYVLYDTLGSSRYKRYKEMQKRLNDMGAKWRKMLPIQFNVKQYDRPDLRNHRKIIVVDNRISYLGSLNMIQRTYGRGDGLYYLELAARMEGPVVNECAAVSASDWYAETGKLLTHFTTAKPLKAKHGHVVAQVLPSGPGYTYENNLKLFISLIYTAKKSIVITNPYFVPEESLLSAITSAAQRGVKISMLNSEIMDQWLVGHAQRSYYEQIMNAGAEIHLYKRPVLQHSKYMVIDKAVAVVGSSNMDVRSFELDLECVSIFYDKHVSKRLYDLHMEHVSESTLLTAHEWSKRSLFSALLDGIARLTSALQ